MRELKFRVWNEREKTYEDGWNYFISDTGELYALKYGALIGMSGVDYLKVERPTGLMDKNCKEIYEGDIVRYSRNLSCNTPPESRTEIVNWWSGEEEYYPCCTSSGFSLPFSEDGYEVIGNIHKNPELLEDKE